MGELDPDIVAHLARFGAHRELSERLAALAPAAHAGSVVFAFYAALHLAQAYLLTKGERFVAENHGARRVALKRAPELRAMLAPYELLQARSESVRYDPRFEVTESISNESRQLLSRVEMVVRGKLLTRGYSVP